MCNRNIWSSQRAFLKGQADSPLGFAAIDGELVHTADRGHINSNHPIYSKPLRAHLLCLTASIAMKWSLTLAISDIGLMMEIVFKFLPTLPPRAWHPIWR